MGYYLQIKFRGNLKVSSVFHDDWHGMIQIISTKKSTQMHPFNDVIDRQNMYSPALDVTEPSNLNWISETAMYCLCV